MEVEIIIDGRRIRAKEDENLLKVALKNNIFIPSLCYYEKVSPTGVCRLCLVKVEGMRGFVPACTTYVKDGMKVTANDDELYRLRRDILDMLLSEHNADCIACDKNGSCELQDLAYRFGLETRNRIFRPIWQEVELRNDDSSHVLHFDGSKCVKCQRCIKACYEIQGKGVLSFAKRGIDTHVVAGFGVWKDSECDGCGECVQACPVGAISEKPVFQRVREIDVEKRVKTTCPYCGVGCQIELWVKDGRIVKLKGVEGEPNNGSLCVKGRFGFSFVHSEERLKSPLLRDGSEFRRIDWEDAIHLFATKLREIKEKYGPDSIAVLASAKMTNEENYLLQKLTRAVIGTNNIDHCARL